MQEKSMNDIKKKYCWFLLGAYDECVEFYQKTKKSQTKPTTTTFQTKKSTQGKLRKIMRPTQPSSTKITLRKMATQGNGTKFIRPIRLSPTKKSVFHHILRP